MFSLVWLRLCRDLNFECGCLVSGSLTALVFDGGFVQLCLGLMVAVAVAVCMIWFIGL